MTIWEWPNFFQCCYSLPTCTIISIVSFTRRNLQSIHDISFVKETVTKTGICKRLSKNCIKFYWLINWCCGSMPVMYPVWGQEAGFLTHRQRRLLTQKRTFSPAYYFTVVKHCERLYYFSWFMAGLFTHQSVYSYISNCSWKNKLSRVW